MKTSTISSANSIPDSEVSPPVTPFPGINYLFNARHMVDKHLGQRWGHCATFGNALPNIEALYTVVRQEYGAVRTFMR